MAERQYAEALAATEKAQSFERAGHAAQAVPLFQQALRILKRLAVIESAAQRARLQPTIEELTTRVAELQHSSEFLLARAMEQHASAREAEESDSTKTDIIIHRYIAAAETYMQALNALPTSEATARAALKEQLEYVIDYVSQLKAGAQTTQNQIQQQVNNSSDDVDVAALQWPEPPTLQDKTALVTPAYASAAMPAVRPVTDMGKKQKQEEKSGAAYTPQELDVLRRSSQINGHLFVPWLDDLDAQEKFSLPEPFADPDGHVPLSAKQKKKEATWMRPSDCAAKCGYEAPVMIADGGVNPLVVKQDIVTDCSFVASLCIAAAYEQRFQKHLITNIIFPADPRTKQPVYNPFGKYVVKLWANGVPRKVVIDDLLPVSATSGQLLSSCTTRKNELWVSLIEKAYLKLNGGYDFPGGNSGIDLFALTGWVPERVPVSELIDAPSKEERLWEQLKSAFHYGDCIITMSTGDITKQEAKAIGLVPMHVYAVLNVYELANNSVASKEGKKIRLLQVKNPWRKMSWKGPYSRHDKTRWDSAIGDELRAYQRQFYAPGESEANEAGGQQDDGLFWIDFESVKQYFESLYMNWNPELFPYKGFLTLHVYRGTPGKRVFYNHCAVSRGTYSNNPHTLVSLDLDLTNDSEQPCFTLVASQYEKFAALDYTLSIFSTRPFTCMSIPQFPTTSPTSVVIPGAWDSACAGGRPFYSTFMNNPQFHLQLQKPCRSLFLFLETEVFSSKDTTTASFPINLRAALHTRERVCGLHAAGDDDSVVDEPLKVLSSGEYRPGFCFIEVDAATLASGLHDVVLIPSTFEQDVLGKFTLRVVSDPPAGASIAYHQIPAEGHGMELTRLRGKWEIQTGSAAGCSNYGCYTFNPSVITCMRECMKTFELGTRDQQIKFLESATCTDVRYGESVGRDSILKHWVNLALLLRDSAPILLEHCESSVGFLEQDVAVGYMSALLVIRLTTRSLATAFPLTLSSTRLRDKMLQNPTFGLPMTTVFQFDEQGKICRYDPTIDLVTGLYAVIRDYRDVASILESANIDASGEIRGLGLDFYCGVEASLVDKHSVAFLLASGEDTRQTDTGGQTATRVAGV
ncbi:hypothetical protein PInf_010466 [Phytophthora infestans]|nr:hypothetical protein PInf_010466 [Phytophthora infestans]